MSDKINKAEILRRLNPAGAKDKMSEEVANLAAADLLKLDDSEVTLQLNESGFENVSAKVHAMGASLGLPTTAVRPHLMSLEAASVADPHLSFSPFSSSNWTELVQTLPHSIVQTVLTKWRSVLPTALTMATLIVSVSITFQLKAPPSFRSELSHDFVPQVPTQVQPLASSTMLAPIGKNSLLPDNHPVFTGETFLIAANSCRECHVNVFPDLARLNSIELLEKL